MLNQKKVFEDKAYARVGGGWAGGWEGMLAGRWSGGQVGRRVVMCVGGLAGGWSGRKM